MNEPNFIKCHMFTADGAVKEYNIYPDDFPPNYTLYLYRGELYFREIMQYGNRQNIMIHKDEFDRLLNPSQNSSQTRQAPPPPKSTPVNNFVAVETPTSSAICPKCGESNISFQREQSGNIGAFTNKVRVAPTKKTHGCLYWMCFGWVFTLMYWVMIGWWYKPLFGRQRGGIGFNANKTINHTVAVCQNCGYTWKV